MRMAAACLRITSKPPNGTSAPRRATSCPPPSASGTLYEKGLGTKKDIARARTYYLQAAEKGNAKAMHNLAVLDADGGGLGPDYKSAAAMVPQGSRARRRRQPVQPRHPVRPRHRRGTEPRQIVQVVQPGRDPGRRGRRKRDDIAKRLDAQSLAAARLAAQTFVPEHQPDTATSSGAPAGGWDAMPPAKTAARPTLKPAAARTAAR